MQQPVKYLHKRLDSTNLYVGQLLPKLTSREPVWVRAEEQFAGKGQGANSWISEAGLNLTGTLVIFPDKFEAVDQFVLSESFALAVAAFLELFIDGIKIKWPNDLYAGDKKIGGILIETAILGKFIDHAIMGVGININQEIFPGEIPNPASISMLTGMKYDLVEMEDLLLESFRNQYSWIESGRFDLMNDQYINKLYRFGEMSLFKTGDQVFKGRITGVNEFGHLLLQTESGTTQTFAYQEVEYLF